MDRERNDYGSLGGLGNMGNNNTPQYNTYGLSPQFLDALGIIGPLSNRVFVANVSLILFTKWFKVLRKLFYDFLNCSSHFHFIYKNLGKFNI